MSGLACRPAGLSALNLFAVHLQLYNAHLSFTFLQAIEQAATLYDDYCRVITPENLLTEESEEVCAMLVECLELRRKWLFTPAANPEQRRVSV
jgi:hypothetical protein